MRGTFTLADDRNGRVPVEPGGVWGEAQLIGGTLRIDFYDQFNILRKKS